MCADRHGHSRYAQSKGRIDGEECMKETIPVVIYVAQGQLEANVVKSRLESEGIPALLQYESVGIVFGMTVDGLGEVKVMVPAPLEAQARTILEEVMNGEDEPDATSSGTV